MRRTLLVGALVVALLVALGVWQGPRLLGRDADAAERAARAFGVAWTGGTLSSLTWSPTSVADPPAAVAALTAGLSPADGERPSAVTVAGVTGDRDRRTATLDVRWELGQPWSYRTQLPLSKVGGRWLPELTPAVVHPALRDGLVLRARAPQAPRAPITGGDGTPLVTERPVVTVGIQPSRAPDPVTAARTAAGLTGVDPAPLVTRVLAAQPDAFVEVVTLRREAYDAVRDRLRPVPGVVLREGTRQLAPTTAFARALLGTVGPATAEVVAASGGRVRADQQVGLSGLQEQFDAQLAGAPGLRVEAAPSTGPSTGPPTGTSPGPQVLLDVAPVPGTPLRTTLDARVQQAADAALAAAPAGKRAALVALRPSTGEVLAVANSGPEGPSADRALTGRYPPGSTFKIASTLALLRQGLTPDETVACPATLTVQGKTFSNAEDEVLGPVPFRTDFADSCNTAFVGSAPRVTPEQLAQAGRDLGYSAYDLGVGAVGGDVPADGDPVLHAAQMIGQGKVLASPLAVAVSAATVAAGRLHPPRVLADAPVPAAGPELPETPALQALTRLVVTSGTGTALAGVPGGQVGGKTGTAEFGTQVPPQTHAWFAGYQGDLAFAVLVEDGGFGGAVAAPLAADLLRRLAG